MSNDKLENIYKLLSEYNFDVNKNTPDKFKCGKCEKILVKACQIQCGCRFCWSCVDEMVYNGFQFCPGITNDCKSELLSTVQVDYRANKHISNLIMKCPEMCSHECELLEMSEHLRICGKKSVERSLYKFGYDMREVTNEKLIGSIKEYNHNKKLIDNIQNEVEKLGEKELRNHEEMNKLKSNLQIKDKTLELINAEMKMMKREKLKIENRLKTVEKMFKDENVKLKSEQEKKLQLIKRENKELNDKLKSSLINICYKINDIELELNKRCENDKIESIKLELIENIEILKAYFDKKVDEIESRNDEIRLEIMKVCKQTINKSIIQMEMEQKINQLKKNVENKMKGIFEMMIDNIDKVKNEYISSEYFYARNRPYKLRLNIYPFSDELGISLSIYDDVVNKDLPFPFAADVTIKIIIKNKREVSKSITKYCQIEKPNNNSFNTSDEFIFSLSELTKVGISKSNCFIIECCVELK